MRADQLLLRIRICLVIVVIGLLLSGLSAFPLQTELPLLVSALERSGAPAQSEVLVWLRTVRDGLAANSRQYPFLQYGTDWLGFAHLVIAIAFIGPFRDPVRNRWVVTFGIIACFAVLPLALIAGYFRDVPVYWRVVDCSFGLVGAVPLLLSRRYIAKLEQLEPPQLMR